MAERLRFEKLEVRRKALAFAIKIYGVTKGFPRSESFGLTAQMRRAGVSVAANIAEGASRASPADKARFPEIAYGSLCEVTTMLQIAESQGFITTETLEQVYAAAMEVCRLLSGYRRSMTARAEACRKEPAHSHKP